MLSCVGALDQAPLGGSSPGSPPWSVKWGGVPRGGWTDGPAGVHTATWEQRSHSGELGWDTPVLLRRVPELMVE